MSSFHDVLIGSTSSNTFLGGGGLDTLVANGTFSNIFGAGEPGAQSYVGVAGANNAVAYIYASSGVLVDLDDSGKNTGGAAGDTYTNINVLLGSLHNDVLIGSKAGLFFNGGPGDDRFLLSRSPMSVVGDTGTDVVMIAAGGDVSFGPLGISSFERAIVLNGGKLDLSGLNFSNGSAAPTLVRSYSTTQAVTITGSSAADMIFAGKAGDILHGFIGNDSLTGGDGDDTLDGGLGDDILRGGGGNDTYAVDSAADRVTELADAGYDTVQSSIGYTLHANVEALQLTGRAAINGAGNAGDNAIMGNDGNNILKGMGGADVLTAGLGRDQLTGGDGADTFVYRTTAESAVGATRDFITDFGAGDFIDLSAIQAKNGASSDQEFTFIGSDKFSKQAGELHAVAFGANTLVEGDTTGDGKADFQILLKGMVSLSDASFRL